MSLLQLFRGSKNLKTDSHITSANLIDSPTGNRYGLQTDQTYYALLDFTGVVIDEKINADIEFFKRHYFEQDCVCLSMWFKGEDASPYIKDTTYIVAPSHRYFCFFNDAVMQMAKTSDGTTIYYPASMTACYCFNTAGPNGIISAYRVLRNKAKQIAQPLEYDYLPAQFLGYVVKQKQCLDNTVTTVLEFVYNYALDIK